MSIKPYALSGWLWAYCLVLPEQVARIYAEGIIMKIGTYLKQLLLLGKRRKLRVVPSQAKQEALEFLMHMGCSCHFKGNPEFITGMNELARMQWDGEGAEGASGVASGRVGEMRGGGVLPDGAGGVAGGYGHGDGDGKEDLVSAMHCRASLTNAQRAAQSSGRKHWFIDRYEQPYIPKLAGHADPTVHVYYKALGMGIDEPTDIGNFAGGKRMKDVRGVGGGVGGNGVARGEAGGKWIGESVAGGGDLDAVACEADGGERGPKNIMDPGDISDIWDIC